MKVEINTKIKVFPQLYVGLKAQFHYDSVAKTRTQKVNLGFATPLENNAAFEKRKRTVDDWSRPFGDWDPIARVHIPGKKLDPITVDNSPIAGFKITDDVRRIYWGGGNVVWRVEDPRGFELEISSGNLMAIIQTVGLQPGGNIPGKCVWARDGANNVLLHEVTEEFKTAYQVGKTKSALSTKLTPESIGAKVSFSSGYVGTYLGSGSTFIWNPRGDRLTFDEMFYHFFKDEDGKRITLYRDPKPLLVEPGEPLTDEDALKLINSKRTDFTSAGSSYGAYGAKFTKVHRAKKAKSFHIRLDAVPLDRAVKELTLELQRGAWSAITSKNALLFGVKDDAMYLLRAEGTDQYNRYGWYYGTAQKDNTDRSFTFRGMRVEGRKIVDDGRNLTVKLTNVPNERSTPENLPVQERLLRQLLSNFDAVVEATPGITY